MLLSQALRLSPQLDINRGSAIAFVGAGGKTTAIFQLARELSPPVLVTTTTHLGAWQIPLADHHIIAREKSDLIDLEFRDITLITDSIQGDRVVGVKEDILYWLCAYIRTHNITLLIEADGSRQKALKASNEHEPVIPESVDIVIVTTGLNGLGKTLNEENVHHPQLFSTLSGLPFNESITSDALVRVLTHLNGGLKNIPPRARRIVLLNQADTPESQSIGGKMSAPLLEHFDSVIVGSLQQ